MGNVVNLWDECPVTVTPIDVANALRNLADRVENGDYSNVVTCVCILEASDKIHRYTIGPPGTCKLITGGLLSKALYNLHSGD